MSPADIYTLGRFLADVGGSLPPELSYSLCALGDGQSLTVIVHGGRAALSRIAQEHTIRVMMGGEPGTVRWGASWNGLELRAMDEAPAGLQAGLELP